MLTALTYIDNIFLTFLAIIIILYIIISGLSSWEFISYFRNNKHFNYNDIISYPHLPTISVIAPAYNEQQTIVDNIKCLLSLNYPYLEIIIVNDGSSDDSLKRIIKTFSLIKISRAIPKDISCKKIRGVYKSTNSAFSNLLVVDKENGGKGDSLNAGINISRSKLFLAVDVDSIIEPDALLKMVKPFLEQTEKRVIASGGVVRIANSCQIERGRVVKVIYPTEFLAKFQVLEYFRAFTLGRMAWSRINGLLIISGAFGLFDRKLAIRAGGYDITTVGEDLELVVRMRRYMHEKKLGKYIVAFIPDPLCWTEVPSSLKSLYRQRNRWTRGAIDTISKHAKLFFNPKYGRMGLVSFPYWVFIEWLGPLVEATGLIYIILLIVNGLVDYSIFIHFAIFAYSFSLMYSLFAILIESISYNKYKGTRYLANIILFSIIEIFIYHPIIVFSSVMGNIDYFFRNRTTTWGKMKRTGFDKKEQ